MLQKNLLATTFSLLTLFSPAAQPAQSQPAPLIPSEAPEALFSTQWGDADVDIFLSGTWKIDLTYGAGMVKSPGGGIRLLDTMPGITPGFIFNQLPDITFSLWLMQFYFFDFSYLGNAADNIFFAGYENPEGELLKHIYLGNREISIPPYRYLEIPETGNASLGVEALLATENSEHDLLLRYDNNTPASKLFIGANEVVEYILDPAAYIPDRYYRLPDSTVSGLICYLEDTAGSLAGSDGRSYREATTAEVVLDGVNGIVSLKNTPAGRVLIYYTKANLPVGTDNPLLGVDALAGETAEGAPDPANPQRFYFDMASHLGTDMAARRINLEGQACLLLGEPGRFSPFAILNTYPLEADLQLERWQYKFALVHKGSRDEKENLPYPVLFKLLTDTNQVVLGRSLVLRDSLYNLYPLPDERHRLYGPGKVANPAYPDYELLLQIFYPQTSYNLEPGIVEGSVQVLRNGTTETGFQVDYESGVLSFRGQILPTDRLEVFYKRKTEALNNGDILFAWGNRIDFREAGMMDLGLGLRWNALPGAYSEETFSRTGALTASWEYRLNRPRWNLSAYAGASFSNPDTTGILHLAGMESDEIPLELEEKLAYPAALPSEPTSLVLTAANRGRLLYKDYREPLSLGDSYLHPADWEGFQPIEYASGGKPGPYNVGGNSAGDDGLSLVLDFEIDTAPGWVGTQLAVPAGDLTRVNSILLSYRATDIEGDCRLYLQLGSTGEDLDGDGVLDSETGMQSTGFLFKDDALPGELIVGATAGGEGNGRLDSEDCNGNLLLDAEIPEQLVSLTTVELNFTPGPDTGWSTVTFSLSEEQQARLCQVRSARLLVVNTGVSSCSGKLFIDALQLQGTVSITAISDGNDNGEVVTARHLPELFLSDQAEVPLVRAYPEVEENFHKNGELQRVLEVGWQDLEINESWEVAHYLPAAPRQLYYKTLALYLRLPQIDTPQGAVLKFELVDYANRGLHYSFTPTPASAWQELSLDLTTGAATLAGESLPGSLERDTSHGALAILKISCLGSANGLLYVDELHLRDTTGSLGGAVGIKLDWNLPGALLHLGSLPLLGELNFRQQADFESRGFSSLYGFPRERHSWNSATTLGLDFLLCRLEVILRLNNQREKINLGAGHTLKIPAKLKFFSLTDRFTYTTTDLGAQEALSPQVSRENRLVLEFNSANSLNLYSGAELTENFLKQNWGGQLQSAAGPLLSSNLAIKLLATSAAVAPPAEDYFTAWARAYRYLLPPENSGLLERQTTFLFNPNFGNESLQLQLNSSLEARAGDFGPGSGVLQQTYAYGISLPWQLTTASGGKLKIAPGYSRSLKTADTLAEAGGFSTDLEGLWQGLGAHRYLYNQLPFAEIFASSTEEIFRQLSAPFPASHYTPAFNLSLHRNPGSRLRDLLIPAGIELGVSRDLRKEADTYTNLNTYSLSGRTNAINLFGKYGAYGLFSFYNIDEFSTQYSLNLKADGMSVHETGYTLRQRCSFEGRQEGFLSLENLLSGEGNGAVDNQTTLGFTWAVHPEKEINLPFIQKAGEENGYFTHKEELKVMLKKSETLVSLHPFSFLVHHSTSLLFPERGYVSAKISLGMDLENPVTTAIPGKIWRLGFQASLEANFQL